ncbi:glycosyltransferase [Candidatus Micrarchaeota archaeon]|nr:glycosyltransferase [Candidatus Micrarchaeota archaeon]MBU1930514.1 glycosyltransferase [Candidatus Micrarchaeota archaeon]
MDEKKMLVSVVIPCYNSEKLISKCLDSLVSQKTDFNYEIIVVDSSKDNTPKIIKNKFPSVKLIHLNEKTFAGAGRNIGVKKSLGEIIAFIDSDCVAPDNWLKTAVESINTGYNIVGGSVKNANPSLISTADYLMGFNEFHPNMPKKEVKFMPTCNLICKKKAFNEIGGFSPDFPIAEDTIFNYKATKKNTLLFNPKIMILHHNRDSFEGFMTHQYNFGKYCAISRKRFKLPGKIFTKYPILSLLIPFAKVSRITFRITRWNPKILPQFILVLPITLLGIITWSTGFIKSAFTK